MGRQRKITPAPAAPPNRQLRITVPGLVAVRLEELRRFLGAPSAGAAVARLVRFYDRLASSVFLEGATVQIRHKDGKWENLDPEEL